MVAMVTSLVNRHVRRRQAPRFPLGPRSRIVSVLHDYPFPMSLDMVADLVGQSRSDVERYIEPYIHNGWIHQEGDLISLSDQGALASDQGLLAPG